MKLRRSWAFAPMRICSLTLGLVPLLAGCGNVPPQFSTNQVLLTRLSLELGEPLAQADVRRVEDQLTAALGTPDSPHLPDALAVPVSFESIRRAAGPVFSTEDDVHFGLFRKHCVRCHGLTGDGKGPAAKLLAPYPRDFRLGKFKFKSTVLGVKPTRQDLTRTIVNGIPGTSMPSFHLLKEDEIRSLVDYVIYLTVRGETETTLFNHLAWEEDSSPEDVRETQVKTPQSPSRSSEVADPIQGEATRHRGFVDQLVLDNFQQWNIPEMEADVRTPVEPQLPGEFPVLNSRLGLKSDLRESLENNDVAIKALMASIGRGEALFRGQVANCSMCHAVSADGKAPMVNYDDWTKAWTDTPGVDVEDKTTWSVFLEAGALKPVPASFRNLRLGAFRGGDQPEDIYRRIVLGIEGTPMPAVARAPDGKAGLTELQVWDLVNYCLSLRFFDGELSELAETEQSAENSNPLAASSISASSGEGRELEGVSD